MIIAKQGKLFQIAYNPYIHIITRIVQLGMTDNSKKNIQNHLFSLTRFLPECKITRTVVDFSHPFLTNLETRSAAPSFNPDRCYNTPTFILCTDAKTQEKALQSEKIYFDRRLTQVASIQNTEPQMNQSCTMQVVVPPSSYCQICQEYFNTYDQHLQKKTHILRWKHNEFNDDIFKLCQLPSSLSSFSSTPSKRKQITKEKKMHRENSVKHSPKTQASQGSKRKMSLSYGQRSIAMDQEEVSFDLEAN